MCEVNVKRCSQCEIEKTLDNFSKQKLGKSGIRSYCKSCNQLSIKKYRSNHPEKIKKKTVEEIKKTNAYFKLRMSTDPEYREKFLIEKRKRSSSEDYKIKARIQRNNWLKNPTNKIAKNMRDRMRSALKGRSKKESTLNMTGISFEELKINLESKFTMGMSWDNYGHDGWHIDHIIPCSFFDFTKDDHQKICFYYKNLQPMWAKENISKGNRINIDNIQSLIMEIKRDLDL